MSLQPDPRNMTTPAPSRLVLVGSIGAVAALYFLAGRLGLSLAYVNASASAVWPPTGIAVAALILFGRHLWPGVAIGAFLVNITTSGSLTASVFIAIGNSLEARDRRGAGRRGTPTARGCSIACVTCSCSPAPLVWPRRSSARPSAVSRSWHPASPPRVSSARVWVTWWMGDALGAVLYAPALILLWTDRRPRTRVELAEAVARERRVDCRRGRGVPTAAASARATTRLASCASRWLSGRRSDSASARRRLPRRRSPSSPCGARSGDLGPYAVEAPNRGLLLAQTFAGCRRSSRPRPWRRSSPSVNVCTSSSNGVCRIRTDQLKLTNDELHVEIAARERVQGALRSSESRLLEAQALAHVGSWEWDSTPTRSALVRRGLSHLWRRARTLRGHLRELHRDGPSGRSGPPRRRRARRRWRPAACSRWSTGSSGPMGPSARSPAAAGRSATPTAGRS